MIYTLISDLGISQNESNKFENTDLTTDKINHSVDECLAKKIIDKKRDCRVLRQPLSLLPEEIKEFIENTKNDLTRSERRLAYTTLLCGVKVFFDIEGCTIAKTSDGKPYLIRDEKSPVQSSSVKKDHSVSGNKKYQKNEDLYIEIHQHQKNKDFSSNADSNSITKRDNPRLYVSISHSDGVIAVCISDEGEVGVDIQYEIEADKAERLEKRFLSGIDVKNDILNVKYYYCSISENEAVFTPITPMNTEKIDFTFKWAYAESILKLYGNGFGDLGCFNELSCSARTEIKSYQGVRKYAISTAIKGR